MFMCKLLSRMTLTLLLSALSVVYAAAPDVLTQVPSTAELVIVSGKLSDFNAKLSSIVTKFGIPAEVSLDVITQELSDEIGMEEPLKLDMSRSACFAMTSFMAGQKALLLYLPVDDPQALLDSADCEKLESGLYKFNSDGYITAKGKYLVIGSNEANLKVAANSTSGMTAPAAVASDMASSDIVAFANLTNVMNMAKFMVPAGLASVPELQSQPELVANIQSAVNTIAELNKLSLGIKVGDDGFLTKANMFYADGGELSRILKPYQQTSAKELAAMPDGHLISANAISADPAVMNDIYSFVLDAVAMATKGKVEGLDTFLTEIKGELSNMFELYSDKIGHSVQADYIGQTEGVAPEAAAITLTKSDINKENVDKIINGFLDKKFGKFFEINSYEPNAGEVDGVSYASLKYSFGQLIQSGDVFSTEMNMYFGQAQSGMYAQAMDKAVFPEAVALAKSSNKLSANVDFMNALNKLPKSANMYFIFNTDNAFDYIGSTIKAQTQQMAQQHPEMAMQAAMMGPVMDTMSSVNGYMAAAVELEDGYIRKTGYISTQTVDSFVNAVKSIIQGFMGMQMGGNNGGAAEF